MEAGTRIVQLGYGGNKGDVGGGEVDEIVDRAQAEIYQVTERRDQDYVVLEELLQPTMDDIDAIAMAGGQAAGVPTGFADLDNLTNGLYPGQMIMWRPGPARHREVHARFGYCPARRGEAPEDGGDFLAGNVQDRDHHAAAVRRGRDPVVADAVRG